jgi:chorismate mutase/prephenate dehydratase
MFMDSNLLICGEIELPIHHHLLSHVGSVDAITRIFAHQQALAQCRIWLDSKLPDVERVAVNSNAEAAKLASHDQHVAAIAGEGAADIYQLPILARNLEDEVNNTTRFLVLGQQAVAASEDDKTSLLFTTNNKPGSLQKMLTCFSEHGVSLTHIESRPLLKDIWRYVFFVDIEGHQQDAAVAKALDDLHDRATMVKLLGSYPRAVR